MRSYLFLFLLLTVATVVSSQSKLKVEAQLAKVIEHKVDPKSEALDIQVILPETKFESIRITLNDFDFAFNCSKTARCEPLYASDISGGAVTLSFQKGKLSKIGTRPVSSKEPVLSDEDTLSFIGTGITEREIIFGTPAKNQEQEVKKVTGGNKGNYISFYCNSSSKDTGRLAGLPDAHFLCDSIKASACDCGLPVRSPYEHMYLPPCFDPKGNAISVQYHLLYDMSSDDPYQKVTLFKIKRDKYEKNCAHLKGKHFQYAKVKVRLSPRVHRLMALSVIAHKDSTILIDTNYVNYFLDSAAEVEKAFTQAATRATAATGAPVKGRDTTINTKEKDSLATRYLQASITLSNELVYFNNHYRDLNFLQEHYQAALSCLQVNISNFFKFGFVYQSGADLAAAIESLLRKNELAPQYHHIACTVLSVIAAEYQEALQRRSNYRITTRVIQVPNADELSTGMQTSKAPSRFYRHDFLISGGVKIDFSTGVFVTGLNDRDYILRSIRFQVRDSLTGTVRDTTGNLISRNEKKLNYSTGFMVHLYTRSGYFVNAGLVTGVTFANSDFMFLAGGSLMFRMGNARLALVGGCAFGKKKALDSNHEQYQYDEAAYPTDRIFTLNNPADRPPRFFTDTNISTYEKRMKSWFVGITYNFASVRL